MKANIDYLKNVLGVKHVRRRENIVMSNVESNSRLMFVGEALDAQANELLSKMIDAMGVARQDVRIANLVEGKEQIEKFQPELVIALGDSAVEYLLKTKTEKQGHLLDFENSKLLITYHPSYLLKNPSAKKLVWEDLKVAMKHLGLKGK